MADDSSLNAPENLFRNDWVEIRDTSRPPHSAICLLYTRWRTGKDTCGTGYIFGERTVFTSGHNLYNSHPDFGGLAYDVLVAPGMIDGKVPYGLIGAPRETLRVFPTFLNNMVRSDDLGAILLPSPVGRSTGWCDLAPHTGLSAGEEVMIAGYPTVGESRWQDLKLRQSRGKVISVADGLAQYDADAMPGQSGGPVWRASDQMPYIMVMGFHNADVSGGLPNLFHPFSWLHYDWIRARTRESMGEPFAELDAAVAARLPSAYRASWRLTAALKGTGPAPSPGRFRLPPRRPGQRIEGGENDPARSVAKAAHRPAEPSGKPEASVPEPGSPPEPSRQEELGFTVPPKGQEGVDLELATGQILRGSIKIALAAGTFTDCDLVLEDEDGKAADHLPMSISSSGAEDFRSERFALTAQTDGRHRLVLKELNGVSAALVRLKLKPLEPAGGASEAGEIRFTVPMDGVEGVDLDLSAGQIVRGTVKVALTAGPFAECDLALEDEDGIAADHLPMAVSSAGAEDFHAERFALTAQADGPHRLVLKALNGVSAALVRIKIKAG